MSRIWIVVVVVALAGCFLSQDLGSLEGRITAEDCLEGETFCVDVCADLLVDEVKESEFDGIVIPGGYAPDKLRRYPKILELVRQFDRKKKLVAFICHAGWVPISANILKGRQATSFFAIRDDMENAGVIWEDYPVVIDGNLVSSRTPQDLGHFCQAILKVLNASST